MANYTNLNDLFTDMANAIRAKKNSTDIIIADNFPTEIENLKTGFDYNNTDVTAIPNYAFYGCEDLNSVDCYNLTSVGASAFENCTNLKTVILWDNVESVGENAFKGCGDVTIYCYFDSIPDTWHENWNPDGCEVVWLGEVVETWDISATEEDNVTARLYSGSNACALVIAGNGQMKAFNQNAQPWYNYRTNITLVKILNGVTGIGRYAFYDYTNLISIAIPNSITSIGRAAFDNTVWLTTKQKENPLVIVNNILIDGRTCNGNITIPYGVNRINDIAFEDSHLTSVTIPDSVTSIGGNAFYKCYYLASITIPNSVTSIGGAAFNNTKYYSNSSNWENDMLYIDNHLISAKNTLSGEYVIKDGTLTIAGSAFDYCESLTSITIPNSVTSIGESAFYGCSNLTSITIPDSVISIGNSAFSYCESLTSITIPDSVTSMGDYAFSCCKALTSITIPDSVISIGNWAFDNCDSLTSITIPDSVTSIGDYAFAGCDSLTSITIPDSVTRIAGYALQNCSSLTSITYTGTVSQWNAITFGTNWNRNTGNYTIHCTDGDIAKDGTITYHTT